MFKLIPTEYWDYNFADMIRGLVVATSSRVSWRKTCIDIPSVGRCFAVGSGRAGIVLALKTLALRPGASIGVPLYCCPVVLKAIATAGCRPCFIDVDLDTLCMSAADLADKSSKIEALIAVHIFGNLCDVSALRRAAPGKPIIEDCAQALGSRMADQAAGSLGDIAVFSFRSGKYLSAGEGGAVRCNQSDIESRLIELIEELPAPHKAQECIHVLKTYSRSLLRTKPFWGLIGDRLWAAYGKNTSLQAQGKIVMKKIYQTDRYTAMRRLPMLPSLIARQRSNAERYERASILDRGVLCREGNGVFFNRLQYPLLLASSDERNRFCAYLRQNEVSAAKPYNDIVAIATEQYGYSGDCSRAERVAQTVLVVPCNYALKPAEVEKISSAINGAWNSLASRKGNSALRPAPMSVVSAGVGGHSDGGSEQYL